ncbi:MAG: protein kinase, partial [Planctomycetota bacterium]
MASNTSQPSSSLSNPDFDFELARLVIENGYATKEQIQESMKEQHSLLQQGQEMQLGQILIRKKYLTVAQFLQLLPKNSESSEVLQCSQCEAKFNVSGKKTGTKIRCKRCQTVLVVPEKAQATVQATLSPAPEIFLSQEQTQIQNIKPKSKTIPRSVEDETRIQSKNSPAKALLSSSKIPTAIGGERRFGKYEILGEIARGGMGIVYKARQIDFNRVVALKVLKQGEFSTEEQVARFKREAQSAARLNHPNIIPIHEIGEVDGNHYFTMEYIDGPSLDEWLKDKSLSQKKIIKVLKQIASGLEAAHAQQIIHRDLKPANILIDDQGIPKITDFGLAKMLDDQNHLTQSNAVVGTPYYMSPEQTRGESKQIGACSDVYALGVLAYHLLTKKLPFAGNSTMEIYHKINTVAPKPPNEVTPKIDKILSAIILKAMAKEIKDRYPSTKAFAEDLERYEAKEKVSAYQESTSKKWIFLLSMVLCLGIGFGSWYGILLMSRPPTPKIKLELSEAEKAKQLEDENKRVALEMERNEREKEEKQKQEQSQ